MFKNSNLKTDIVDFMKAPAEILTPDFDVNLLLDEPIEEKQNVFFAIRSLIKPIDNGYKHVFLKGDDVCFDMYYISGMRLIVVDDMIQLNKALLQVCKMNWEIVR